MVEQNGRMEGINLKKLLLFFRKKIGMVGLAGVAGALIGSGLYLLITALTAGPQEYKITYDFYINFSDGTMEAHDYYNAYTWNEVLKKDFLLDETMKALEQVSSVTDVETQTLSDGTENQTENQNTNQHVPTKEEVAASLEATCPTDVKYMTVAVTYTDPVWAERIAEACVISLRDFGIRMEEFDAIDLIHVNQVETVPRGQFSIRAMMTGVVTFVILYVLYFLFQYACDDSIYLPEEFEDRYGIRVLGMVVKNRANRSTDEQKKTADKDSTFRKYLQKEMLLNLDFTIKHEKPVYICAVTDVEADRTTSEKIREKAIAACQEMNHKSHTEMVEEHTFASYEFLGLEFPVDHRSHLDEIRKSCGVILAVPCGMKNGKIIGKLIHDLTVQDCKILGAILVDAEEEFLRAYYRTGFVSGKKV